MNREEKRFVCLFAVAAVVVVVRTLPDALAFVPEQREKTSKRRELYNIDQVLEKFFFASVSRICY